MEDAPPRSEATNDSLVLVVLTYYFYPLLGGPSRLSARMYRGRQLEVPARDPLIEVGPWPVTRGHLRGHLLAVKFFT